MMGRGKQDWAEEDLSWTQAWQSFHQPGQATMGQVLLVRVFLLQIKMAGPFLAQSLEAGCSLNGTTLGVAALHG